MARSSGSYKGLTMTQNKTLTDNEASVMPLLLNFKGINAKIAVIGLKVLNHLM